MYIPFMLKSFLSFLRCNPFEKKRLTRNERIKIFIIVFGKLYYKQ